MSSFSARVILRSPALYAVLCFLLLNAAYFSLWERSDGSALANTDTYVWEKRIELIQSGRAARYEILILGDSQAMSGILPERLAPGRAYNLGVPSQQPEGLESMLALLRKSGARPRLLILNLNAFSMYKSPVYQAFLTYYRATLLRRAPRPALAGRRDLIGKGAGDGLDQALRFFPLYNLHDALRPAVSFADNLSDIPLDRIRRHPESVGAARVNEYLRSPYEPIRGLQKTAAVNRRVAEMLATHAGYWTWNDFRAPGADNCASGGVIPVPGAHGHGRLPYPERRGAAAAWSRALRVYGSGEVTIVFVSVPLSGAWERVADPLIYKRLDLALTRVSAGIPAVHNIPRPPGWDSDSRRLFHDWTHLSYCGATLYTDYLKRELEARGLL